MLYLLFADAEEVSNFVYRIQQMTVKKNLKKRALTQCLSSDQKQATVTSDLTETKSYDLFKP